MTRFWRVLLIVALLAGVVGVWPFPPQTASASTTITSRVAASTDDTRVYYLTGTSAWYWDITPAYSIVGDNTAGGARQYGIGMRFAGLNIPSGATITAATITFTGNLALTADTLKSSFCGELSKTALTFSTIADYQARRGTDCGGANNNYRTGNETAWQFTTDWAINSTYVSPDLSTIIQEIVTKQGGLTNAVIWWDDYDDLSTHGAYRSAYSYDGSTTAAPLLSVTWNATPTVTVGAADHINGLQAELTGTCTDDKGETIDQIAFVWGPTSLGDPGNVAPSASSYPNNWTSAVGSFGETPFTHFLDGLYPGTIYYFRSAIHASEDPLWLYSTEGSFTATASMRYEQFLDVANLEYVESGTWTVDSQTMNCRIPYTATELEGAAKTDWAVKVVVDTAYLVLKGYATATGNETRWGNGTGTLYDFWLYPGSTWNSTTTTYWVEISMTANGTTPFYMYVDPDLTTSTIASSIGNTFPFGDDFNRTDSADVGNSWTEDTNIFSIDTNRLKILAVDEGSYWDDCHKAHGLTTGKYFIEARMMGSSLGTGEYLLANFLGNDTGEETAELIGNGNNILYTDSTGNVDSGLDATASTWGTYQWIYDFDTNKVVSYIVPNFSLAIEQFEVGQVTPYNLADSGKFMIGVVAANAEAQYVDWVFVRKYAVNPPLVRIGAPSGLSFVVNKPTKYANNPVFGNDTWTWDRDVNFPTVDKNADWPAASQYRMWYHGVGSATDLFSCYTYSETGNEGNWTKPDLDRIEYDGSTTNNIMIDLPIAPPIVSYDPTGAVDRQYVMNSYYEPGVNNISVDIYISADEDGNWTEIKDLETYSWEGGIGLTHQELENTWLAYSQQTTGLFDAAGNNVRWIAGHKSDTSDLAGTWTNYPAIIPAIDMMNQKHGLTAQQYYGILFGFLGRLQDDLTNAPLDQDLYVSRDGSSWSLVSFDWLTRSVGEWDAGTIWHLNGFTEDGNTWRAYYSGSTGDNRGALPQEVQVGYATIGLQRIGDVEGTGSITTQPMTPPSGNRLYVNTDATGGKIEVEVLDENGDVLSGYAYTDCDDITVDSYQAEVTWGGEPLPTGSEISLRFYLTDAILYAYGRVYPSGITSPATDKTTTSATLNGEVTDDAGETIDYVGFVFDTVTHGNPGNIAPAASAYSDYWTDAEGDYGEGTFSHGISGLSVGDTIYFRAVWHGTTSDMWFYGEELDFPVGSGMKPNPGIGPSFIF